MYHFSLHASVIVHLNIEFHGKTGNFFFFEKIRVLPARVLFIPLTNCVSYYLCLRRV
jgi:hypothetical protein